MCALKTTGEGFYGTGAHPLLNHSHKNFKQKNYFSKLKKIKKAKSRKAGKND